jgi:hypothetical protein
MQKPNHSYEDQTIAIEYGLIKPTTRWSLDFARY